MTDTLWFETREDARVFMNAVMFCDHEVAYVIDTDCEDGYPHGVEYAGPEVTEHSKHIGSNPGRRASRFANND
jgi:hypothetical protein